MISRDRPARSRNCFAVVSVMLVVFPESSAFCGRPPFPPESRTCCTHDHKQLTGMHVDDTASFACLGHSSMVLLRPTTSALLSSGAQVQSMRKLWSAPWLMAASAMVMAPPARAPGRERCQQQASNLQFTASLPDHTQTQHSNTARQARTEAPNDARVPNPLLLEYRRVAKKLPATEDHIAGEGSSQFRRPCSQPH